MVKNLPDNAGNVGSIPGSGRSLGGGNDNLLLPGKPHGLREEPGRLQYKWL